MERFPKFPRSSAWAALLAARMLAVTGPAAALEVPKGTEIQIRLKAKVSTQNAKVNDAVESVVIAPVIVGNQVAIAPGAVVRGAVEKVTASTKPEERALLGLGFGELESDGVKLKLSAQVAAVDNAREKVDDQGQINGILGTDTITGKLDSGISKITEKYSGLGGFLNAAKNAVLKPAEGDIAYDAGVEMTVKLTAPLRLPGPAKPTPEHETAAHAGPRGVGGAGGTRAVPDHRAESAQAVRHHQPDADRKRGPVETGVCRGRVDHRHGTESPREV